MENNYGYLKQYIPGGNKVNDNWFSPVTLIDIELSEKEMGRQFPLELRQFYEQIGFGMLRSPKNPPTDYKFYSNNEILQPDVAAHFYLGIMEHQTVPKEEALNCAHNWLALDTLSDFEPGDLPFFEISDSSSFMIMKLNSENPNAVWFMGFKKIEDSFERFIWKLYHEGPDYYIKDL